MVVREATILSSSVTYSSDPAITADRGSSAGAGVGASVSSSTESGVTKAEASYNSSPSSLMRPRSRVTYSRPLLGVVVLRKSRVTNVPRMGRRKPEKFCQVLPILRLALRRRLSGRRAPVQFYVLEISPLFFGSVRAVSKWIEKKTLRAKQG